uniref:Uncharacterized protein n=1 Tax=Triticum urartu TaxID=4572 RepID=A0A8R7V7H8_TRIUA
MPPPPPVLPPLAPPPCLLSSRYSPPLALLVLAFGCDASVSSSSPPPSWALKRRREEQADCLSRAVTTAWRRLARWSPACILSVWHRLNSHPSSIPLISLCPFRCCSPFSCTSAGTFWSEPSSRSWPAWPWELLPLLLYRSTSTSCLLTTRFLDLVVASQAPVTIQITSSVHLSSQGGRRSLVSMRTCTTSRSISRS